MIIAAVPNADSTAITPDPARAWRAVLARDAASDGTFVFAVATTGVYCRPSCPARHPRRENVSFFRRPGEAEAAGFRACLRCRPATAEPHTAVRAVQRALAFLETHAGEDLPLAVLARGTPSRSSSPATGSSGATAAWAATAGASSGNGSS